MLGMHLLSILFSLGFGPSDRFSLPLPPPPAMYLRFQQLNDEDGLSQNTVYHLAQDDSGYIWIATQDGLNRFDGYEVRVFHHDMSDPGSISNNWINNLVVDNEGELWIGTSFGMNQYRPGDGTFRQFLPKLQDLNNGYHRGALVLVDHGGGTWTIKMGPGLAIIDGSGELKKVVYPHHFIPESSVPIRGQCKGEGGSVWVMTLAHLLQFDEHLDLQRKIDLNLAERGMPGEIPNGVLRYRRDGSLWLSTNSGLHTYILAADEWRFLPASALNVSEINGVGITDLIEDGDGNLWIAGNYGLAYWPAGAPKPMLVKGAANSAPGLVLERVSSLLLDHTGTLWLGTLGQGLFKANISQASLAFYGTDVLPNPNVKALLEDSAGHLWVGTAKGVHVLENKGERYGPKRLFSDQLQVLADTEIYGLVENQRGNIWIASFAGLGFWRYGEQRLEMIYHNPENDQNPASDHLRAVFEDSSGGLWLGTNGMGLSHYDTASGQWSHHRFKPTDANSLSNDFVNCFLEEDGLIWVGTSRGLNRYIPGSKAFTRWTVETGHPQPLPYDFVVALHLKPEQGLWVATHGGGLHFLAKDGRVRSYRQRDGLPSETVLSILEDLEGQLWLSTNNGLARFDPDREMFTHFTVEDGLQGRIFNFGAYAQGTDGRIFIGGPKGLNTFLPGDMHINPYPPKVVIDEFYLDHVAAPNGIHPVSQMVAKAGPEVARSHEIELAPDQKVFSLGFRALHFESPARNRYAYMLEGFDKHWIHTGPERRWATYTDLPPGAYRFRVLAANKDGVWNQEGAALDIRILPHWWQSRPAMGALFLLFVLACLWVYRHHRRKVSKMGLLLLRGFSYKSQSARNELFAVWQRRPVTHGVPVQDQRETVETDRDERLPAGNPAGHSPLGSHPASASPTPAVVPEAGPAGSNGTVSVYLFSADPSVSTSVREGLFGYGDLRSFQTLGAGLAALDQACPDLIICEWDSPAIKGTELCRALRDDSQNRVPLLWLVSQASPWPKEPGLPAADFIWKPVRGEELRWKVSLSLQGRNSPVPDSDEAEEIDEIKAESLQSLDERFLRKTIDAVDANYARPEFGVQQLAEEIGLSRRQLHRRLTAVCGLTPVEFLRNLRLQKAAQLLQQKAGNISEVGYAVGFANPSHFSQQFRRVFGQSPRAFTNNPSTENLSLPPFPKIRSLAKQS